MRLGTSFRVSTEYDLFGPVPPEAKPEKKPATPVELSGRLWTGQKSRLIAEYLHRFLYVTKSGTYLDLFAGPQSETYDDDWSIKRVVERRDEGPNLGYFAACDNSPEQIKRLERLRDTYADRPFTFNIYHGDANVQVNRMLRDAPTGLPSFCLIDQRTFECDWATVKTVAEYKADDKFKIEIFYFFAEAWLDRAWKSRKNHETLRRWWGRDDVLEFFALRNVYRSHELKRRFIGEFGYKYVQPWSIHKQGDQGRTMYFMIHASDHYRATRLMSEAYNAVNHISHNGMYQQKMYSEDMDSAG